MNLDQVDPLVSPATFAEMLGVSKKSLWRYISAGTIPPPDRRFTARTIRWRLSTVRKVLEQRKAGAGA